MTSQLSKVREIGKTNDIPQVTGIFVTFSADAELDLEFHFSSHLRQVWLIRD